MMQLVLQTRAGKVQDVMSLQSEQERKIYVGGLNHQTTEEGLKEYFSDWGNIVDCVVMRKGRNGPSRGFGFVTFDNAQAVDGCLRVKNHMLDNSEIEPKRSVPKGEARSRKRRIFVRGLASTATKEDVEEYFKGLCERLGRKVEHVDLIRDKENPSRHRGIAFVTFDSEEVVESICSTKVHQIKLKQCKVERAESPATMRKKKELELNESRHSNGVLTPRGEGNFIGPVSSWGDNGGSFGTYGMHGTGYIGGFGPGGFGNPAVMTAAMMNRWNLAAFGGSGPGAMSNFGGGFNGIGFGGFEPGSFGGFGGFDPGGFRGRGGGEYNVSSAMVGSSTTGESSGGGYEGMSHPMASARGSYPGSGFGGFLSMEGKNRFAAAAVAAGDRVGGSGGGPGDYQMGNYSQMNSSHGPANRKNSCGATGGGKNNRGFRPY